MEETWPSVHRDRYVFMYMVPVDVHRDRYVYMVPVDVHRDRYLYMVPVDAGVYTGTGTCTWYL